MSEVDSRLERILNGEDVEPLSVIEALIKQKMQGGPGGGTTNYNALNNKPKINSVELSGNKDAYDLGISTDRVYSYDGGIRIGGGGWNGVAHGDESNFMHFSGDDDGGDLDVYGEVYNSAEDFRYIYTTLVSRKSLNEALSNLSSTSERAIFHVAEYENGGDSAHWDYPENWAYALSEEYHYSTQEEIDAARQDAKNRFIELFKACLEKKDIEIWCRGNSDTFVPNLGAYLIFKVVHFGGEYTPTSINEFNDYLPGGKYENDYSSSIESVWATCIDQYGKQHVLEFKNTGAIVYSGYPIYRTDYYSDEDPYEITQLKNRISELESKVAALENPTP